jgi:flagellar protein FlaG
MIEKTQTTSGVAAGEKNLVANNAAKIPGESKNNEAPVAQSSPGKGSHVVSREQVQELADKLSTALGKVDTNYSVSVDNDSGMIVVRITDVETGDIVQQVPPEQVLEASASVDKIVGLLVNDQG